ncbi:MAG: Fis family transcriptional regulator [Lachnospiraceae bacterium]|nr:Fis family transcriptional regulator [Lachnospiraceae bacterium]MCI9150556.1 Fis family transcriptional regulator [Lachnospiraceae bacterium]
MVAKHGILVQSGRGIQYKFEIFRKYTVIRGNSATGKTTLVRLIEDATIRKTASLSCDVPCVALPELNWELNLNAFSNSIIFIDEEHPALTSGKRLAEYMTHSNNCFIIISRDKLSWLPYSYKEIYQIKSSGKFHTLERIYEDMDTFIENPKLGRPFSS